MLVLPVMAQPVRVIGGPIGSPIGPTGPTGAQQDLLIDGAAGALGPAGVPGLTGWVGAYGAAAALIGPAGALGPIGSRGPAGSIGPLGFSGIVPPDRFRYFENRSGVVGLPYGGTGSLGCNFPYQPHHSGLVFVAFSALVKPDNISISIGFGVTTAVADAGSTAIVAPGMAVSYFENAVYIFGQPTDSDGNKLPWPTMYFDLFATADSPPFDFTAHGSVININCILMEF